MFDVLTNDMQPELAAKLQQVSNDKLEVFMFANQIPLLGGGKLKSVVSSAVARAEPAKKTRFIAVSEINDLLTYELVPYFEHLYFLRCTEGQACTIDYFKQRMDKFRTDPDARRAYVDELGFEVIDVRAKFAANVFPFVPLVNPLQAHGGHLRAAPVRNVFLCGAEEGQLRTAGCSAK